MTILSCISVSHMSQFILLQNVLVKTWLVDDQLLYTSYYFITQTYKRYIENNKPACNFFQELHRLLQSINASQLVTAELAKPTLMECVGKVQLPNHMHCTFLNRNSIQLQKTFLAPPPTPLCLDCPDPTCCHLVYRTLAFMLEDPLDNEFPVLKEPAKPNPSQLPSFR